MDSSGNEEIQSQYEREDLKYQEAEEEEKPKIGQQIQAPQWGEDEEDREAENLYKTQTVYKISSADQVWFFQNLYQTQSKYLLMSKVIKFQIMRKYSWFYCIIIELNN